MRFMVAVTNVFYEAVGWQIAIFVNSATVIKVSNAEIGGRNKMKLLCWKELFKHDNSDLVKCVKKCVEKWGLFLISGIIIEKCGLYGYRIHSMGIEYIVWA